MATLKLKHLILFVLSFGLLVWSDLVGGALWALLVWMQLSILIWKKAYTLKNQIKFLFLFLFLLPTFFLWGAINSFISIYAKESHIIFILMYGLLSFIICFWVTLFSVFSFAYAKDNEPLLPLFIQSAKAIRSQKFVILYVSLIVYLITILPIPLAEDYRIVLGIIAAHVFLKFETLKSVL